MVISLVAAASFAALFVGAELIEAYLFPTMSMGVRHALLTAQAAVVAVVISGTVFLVMRRQQQQLSDTARRLAQFLVRFQEDPRSAGRFENPHLAHCREVLSCARTDCPMYAAPGGRCWQALALHHPDRGMAEASATLRECQECAVYRQSCPDAMTELGESLNNLIYLLEEGAGEIGRMRAEVAEKQKMAAIGQIAAGVAHEVCNPLASISSVVQMLRRGSRNGIAAPQLDLIETHIARISAVVRQLTKATNPQAAQFQPVDFGQLVEDAVRLIACDPRAKNVKIVFDRPQALPTTYGLPAQLQQTVLNVGFNALDAMPDGGVLTLRAEVRGSRIALLVEDTGCGISAEVGRRVFEPFFTTKEPGCGTGLGLAETYGIVQRHGGTIEFASSPGKGTVFTIEFPLLEQAPEGHHVGSQDPVDRR